MLSDAEVRNKGLGYTEIGNQLANERFLFRKVQDIFEVEILKRKNIMSDKCFDMFLDIINKTFKEEQEIFTMMYNKSIFEEPNKNLLKDNASLLLHYNRLLRNWITSNLDKVKEVTNREQLKTILSDMNNEKLEMESDLSVSLSDVKKKYSSTIMRAVDITPSYMLDNSDWTKEERDKNYAAYNAFQANPWSIFQKPKSTKRMLNTWRADPLLNPTKRMLNTWRADPLLNPSNLQPAKYYMWRDPIKRPAETGLPGFAINGLR